MIRWRKGDLLPERDGKSGYSILVLGITPNGPELTRFSFLDQKWFVNADTTDCQIEKWCYFDEVGKDWIPFDTLSPPYYNVNYQIMVFDTRIQAARVVTVACNERMVEENGRSYTVKDNMYYTHWMKIFYP